jgi:serine protease Do
MKTTSLRRLVFGVGLSCLVALGVGLPDLVKSQDAPPPKNYWTTDSSTAENFNIDVMSLNKAFTTLAERLSQSVVSISTKTKIAADPRMQSQADIFRFFFGNPLGPQGPRPQQPQEAQSLGSGFLINDQGYIITNSHVVRNSGRNADEVFAKFVGDAPTFEGHRAEIVGIDETTDVAVLKLKSKPKSAQVAPLGDSAQLKVGEWVMAIGNPYGHSHSVTTGIVSAMGRSLDGLESRADFIQTDASINPGNSGGPLFNLKGQVIGINTAIDARAQGIGFAIPVDVAKSVVRQLIEKGSVDLGWIGIYMSDLTPGIAAQLGLKNTSGVLVQDVVPGEPAALAGLKSYDVILKINGQVLAGSRDLVRSVSNLSVGSKARFSVMRDGQVKDYQVTIAKRKTDEEIAEREELSLKQDVESGRGMLLTNLNPQIRSQLGLDGSTGGVLVQRVARGSFAAEAGVVPGDILFEINRKPIASVAEALAALKKKEKSYLLKIQRQDATLIILMEMKR